MNDASDQQLLRDYALRRDEAAFAEIVQRYRDLVYSAARRQVSAADAGEVAQSVFIDLAAKAASVAARLAGEASLAGWLHRGTRFAALHHLRAAQRRAANETQAMHHLASPDDPNPDWAHIQPVLDEAIDRLADDDREALLRRFFQNQDFRAVGHALGVSDDAAQKRVSRALDRLRVFLVERGVAVSATALVVVLSSKAVQAAPAGFAVSLASAAKAATSAKTFLAVTSLQKGLAVAAVAAAAIVGFNVYQSEKPARRTAATPTAVAASRTTGAARDEISWLKSQIESLAAALEQAKETNERAIVERDGALRAAAIYKELVAQKQAGADGAISVPSHRSYIQGMGQIAAYLTASKQRDRSQLSEDEKLALAEEEMNVGLTAVRIYRAALAKGMVSEDPTAPSNLNQPDNATCFLSGALDLNQDQFTRAYALINQFNTPGALPILPEGTEITDERMKVVKARRRELDVQLEPLLTPEQRARFKAIQDNVHIINPYDGSVRLGYSWPQ